MKKQLAVLFVSGAFAVVASAAPQTFDFKDPKGVNHAAFKLDAPLEAISGNANGVSGKVTFDPDKPGETKGKIVVEASSLHVHVAKMKEHMHSAMWLDVDKHKEITFEVKELKNVKTADDKTSADATGTLTIKGVAKEMTVPVTLTYLKDKLAARSNGQMKGDLLVIRADFSIKRKDFNIQPGKMEDKVSDTIELSLRIAGVAPK